MQRQFVDYQAQDEPICDHKQKFHVEFFNILLDQAIMSTMECFDQMKACYSFWASAQH